LDESSGTVSVVDADAAELEEVFGQVGVTGVFRERKLVARVFEEFEGLVVVFSGGVDESGDGFSEKFFQIIFAVRDFFLLQRVCAEVRVVDGVGEDFDAGFVDFLDLRGAHVSGAVHHVRDDGGGRGEVVFIEEREGGGVKIFVAVVET